MEQTKRYILVFGLLAITFGGILYGCEEPSVSFTPDDEPRVSQNSIGESQFTEEVIPMDEDFVEENLTIGSDSTTFTFSGPAALLNNIKIGSVLDIPPNDLLPDGALKKVVSISQQKVQTNTTTNTTNTLVCTVDDATLEDKFTTLDMDTTFSLNNAQVQKVTLSIPQSGVTKELVFEPVQKTVGSEIVLSFSESISIERNNQSATATVSGQLTMSVEVNPVILIQNRTIQRMEFLFNEVIRLEADFVASYNGSFGTDPEKPTLLLNVSFVPIPVGPISITPNVSIPVSFRGEMNGELQTGLSAEVSSYNGVAYDINSSPKWLVTDNAPQRGFDYNLPSITQADFTMRAEIGPELFLKIYGIGGPKIGVKGWGEMSIDALRRPIFEANAGLFVDAGVSVRVFSVNMVDQDFPNLYESEPITLQYADLPQLGSLQIGDVDETTAEVTVNVTDNGGASITDRGVVWSKSPGVTLESNEGKLSFGSGDGEATSTIQNLSTETTYYIKGFAENFWGMGYTSEIEITTGQDPVVPTNNLIAYYPFTGNPADSSGNGFGANIFGAPTLVDDRFGNTNSAYQVDNSSEYLVTPDLGLAQEDIFSVSLWINASSLANAMKPLSGEGTTINRYPDVVIQAEGDQRIMFGTNNIDARSTSETGFIQTGRWYHIVGLSKGRTQKIYVDGVFVDSLNIANDGFFSSSGALRFGQRGDGTFPFLGVIDDIHIYDYVISESHIDSLYRVGGWPEQGGGTEPSGSTYTNTIGMEFVEIPAGSFYMGSTVGSSDERPVHQVTISEPYYLGKYEVTQAQWRAVMGSNPSYFSGDDRPVEQVSWNDIQEFIQALNEREGTDKYRLPTEAEWEYAAHAGAASSGEGPLWHFGNNESELGDYAWYRSNSGSQTHPVGQKQPNAWGLYDMHGNVWEWCQDWYGSGYYANSPSTDPQGPSSGQHRVLRGGSWHGDANDTRSAGRDDYNPVYWGGIYGFRLLRTN